MTARKILFILIAAALCMTAAFIGGLVASQPVQPTDQKQLGSFDITVLSNTPTISNVWVGTGLTGDTLVAPTSTNRVRLEITNSSGATSTPQAIYCNVGDRPSVLYSGIVINASSTPYVFGLDNLTRGAVRCRLPVSSSSVSVIDY